ncbi:AI-2E family transporter [Halomicrobium urmianum]|uniref:AI-2E family transporter n=1 Tax=Halomicrobium urmianum TaxID=1586233 RepID=UPI001CD98379|nr:AI-2E family transporter [Halomicrobium urmianum]
MDTSKVFLLGVAGVLLMVSTLMVLPYLEYFLLAVVLASVLAPLQHRLERHTGPSKAAAVLSAAVTVAVLLPLAFVIRAVAADAAALVEELGSGGEGLEEFEAGLEELLGVEVDVVGSIQSAAGNGGMEALGSAIDVFGTLTHVLVGLGLTLFLLFYFLRDGESFFEWLRWVLPLPDHVEDDLFESINHITNAVLAGHVLVAIIQGSLAGAGLFVAGVPNAFFWTAVMIVLSLLPVVGSFLVWGPAAIYLFTIGRPIAAGLLVVYGAIIVGISDDYLRPVVVDRYARVSPAVIIIGILGGLTVMGFIGIFVGPIIIGALKATLDVYREEYEDPVLAGQ